MFKINKCDNYNEQNVAKTTNSMVDFSEHINKGDKVLVKANLLGAFTPNMAITAHPSVVKAVVNEIQSLGATAIIGDSSAGLYNKRAMENTYERTEMKRVSDETGCQLNYDMSTTAISGGNSRLNRLKVLGVLKNVDKVVNVCKVKTHALAKFTCAVKNLYGYVPGLTKGRYHFNSMNMSNYADILIELNEFMPPVLTVVDGIVGMEGQGPNSGTPKQLGILAVGTSTYEIDYNICKIIGLDPMEVLYLRKALQQGKFKENEDDFSEFYVKFRQAEVMPMVQRATPDYNVG